VTVCRFPEVSYPRAVAYAGVAARPAGSLIAVSRPVAVSKVNWSVAWRVNRYEVPDFTRVAS
jgi:hypothetical protein